jgi:hypothetical protein
MWRMMPRPATATLIAALALTLALADAPDARAAAVQSYSYTTSGNISGMTGANLPINFSPSYNQGMLTTPGSFVLGQITTNPLPPTATLTYNNTPFTIDLNVGSVNSPYFGYNYYPGYYNRGYQYAISGVLNGSITGTGTSTMMASVTSITGNDFGLGTTPPFPISELKVTALQGIAAPNGNSQGITTLTAQVLVAGLPLPAPAPEPTSIAAFGAALAGWLLRRRSRSKSRPDA